MISVERRLQTLKPSQVRRNETQLLTWHLTTIVSAKRGELKAAWRRLEGRSKP